MQAASRPSVNNIHPTATGAICSRPRPLVEGRPCFPLSVFIIAENREQSEFAGTQFEEGRKYIVAKRISPD